MSDENFPLPKGYLECPLMGEAILNFIYPFKTIVDERYNSSVPLSKRFNVTKLNKIITERSLRMIIDLTAENNFYDPKRLKKTIYIRIFENGYNGMPSEIHISKFIKVIKNMINEDINAKIGVHCVYGYNMTGFMIVSYLISNQKMTLQRAITAFAESRRPGIYGREFIEELKRIYEPMANISIPDEPAWLNAIQVCKAPKRQKTNKKENTKPSDPPKSQSISKPQACPCISESPKSPRISKPSKLKRISKSSIISKPSICQRISKSPECPIYKEPQNIIETPQTCSEPIVDDETISSLSSISDYGDEVKMLKRSVKEKLNKHVLPLKNKNINEVASIAKNIKKQIDDKNATFKRTDPKLYATPNKKMKAPCSAEFVEDSSTTSSGVYVPKVSATSLIQSMNKKQITVTKEDIVELKSVVAEVNKSLKDAVHSSEKKPEQKKCRNDKIEKPIVKQDKIDTILSNLQSSISATRKEPFISKQKVNDLKTKNTCIAQLPEPFPLINQTVLNADLIIFPNKNLSLPSEKKTRSLIKKPAARSIHLENITERSINKEIHVSPLTENPQICKKNSKVHPPNKRPPDNVEVNEMVADHSSLTSKTVSEDCLKDKKIDYLTSEKERNDEKPYSKECVKKTKENYDENQQDYNSRSDKEPYHTDKRSYNKDDRSYNRDGRSYNRDDRSYNRDDRSYNRDDRSYNRDGRSYNRDDRSYNRDDRSYNRDDRSYNRDDRSYYREKSVYKLDKRPYNREKSVSNLDNRSYNREKSVSNLDNRSYNRDDKRNDRNNEKDREFNKTQYRENERYNKEIDHGNKHHKENYMNEKNRGKRPSSSQACNLDKRSRYDEPTMNSSQPTINKNLIFPIKNHKKVQDLKEKIQNNLKIDMSHFVGSKYTFLTKKNINEFKAQNYLHTWSTNGKRFLLFVLDSFSIYLIDESNMFFKVSNLLFPHYSNANASLTNTLFDGELVTDKKDNTYQHIYLISSVFVIEGNFVDDKELINRLVVIENMTIKPRASLSKSQRAKQPFEIGVKKFLKKEFVNYVWTKMRKEVPHIMIGMLFYPEISEKYRHTETVQIYYWEPIEYKTVSFKLVNTLDPETNKLTGELFTRGNPKPFAKVMNLDEKDLQKYDNNIIKCQYNKCDNTWFMVGEQINKDLQIKDSELKERLEDLNDPLTLADLEH